MLNKREIRVLIVASERPKILKVTSLIVPLRVDEQEEIEGLDLRSHGEKGYHSD